MKRVDVDCKNEDESKERGACQRRNVSAANTEDVGGGRCVIGIEVGWWCVAKRGTGETDGAKLQVINNKHSDFKVAISFKDVALVETICCPKITIVVLDLV